MPRFALLASVLMLWVVVPAIAADAPLPNIILVMADDQGLGDVAFQGHPVLQTPVLDAMAARGLRFDRFYAAAPVCSPTRGSVLTGRHPNRFGCFSWGYTLRPAEITLAEAVRTAGYTTGHFGKWHLGSVRLQNPLSPGKNGFDEWISAPNFYENDPLMSHNGKVVALHGESSMATVEAALPFLKQAVQAKKPFFSVIWFGNPHNPHVPVPELARLYADQPQALQNYYAEITGIDRALGRLRTELTTLGIRDNTLIWYTSDNGPQGGKNGQGSTGGLRGRKGSLWEGGLRVPAVIEWPAVVTQPRRITAPCGSVDIYPTICDLLGVRMPGQPILDGESLVPLIRAQPMPGKPWTRAKPLGFWDYPVRGHSTPAAAWLQKQQREEINGQPAPADDPAESQPWTQKLEESDRKGHAALVDGHFKLHRLPDSGGAVRFALYDLATDPKEQTDIAAQQPDRVTDLRAKLEAWQLSVVRSLNGQDYGQK
ncbi:MAG: sulfatase-like hydrolase/transferase [Bacteroidales bacterium]|nr:sulfatase-like hydrolase/transferase [Bacteroidales bacterium]